MSYERYLFYALFALIFIFNRIGISPINKITSLIFNLFGNIISYIVSAIAGIFM